MITLNVLSFIIYGILGLLVIIIALLIRSEIRLRNLLKGKNAHTLEDTLQNIEHDLRHVEVFEKNITKRLDKAEGELERSIQGIGVVRFTPFKGTSGSNQSFAIAFLNKQSNGVVVSSIYSRENVSIFAKPIINNNSKYDLSAEEKEAIIQASS